MNSEEAATAAQPAGGPTEKVFTVEQANSALVLVRRIVEDIVARYTTLLDLRTRHHDLASQTGTEPNLHELARDIKSAVAELNRLHEELTEIGCVLKDWAGGLVDFPAVYEGRNVWLCWRLGEPAVTHWHELRNGFSGRQPIGPDFPGKHSDRTSSRPEGRSSR